MDISALRALIEKLPARIPSSDICLWLAKNGADSFKNWVGRGNGKTLDANNRQMTAKRCDVSVISVILDFAIASALLIWKYLP